MKMPDMLRKATWLNVILVAAYVYYVWAVAHALNDETDADRTSAELYDRVSRVCYRMARWFGSVGMEAEIRRDHLLEDGRMI